MKYLTAVFCFTCLTKIMAQTPSSAQPRFSLPKGYDSTLTQLEQDSFKRGFIPYTLQMQFEKQHKNYLNKRDSFLKKADGIPVPDFEAHDTSGFTHRPAQYRGRVWLLHFWNFWDYSFQNEIPRLNEIAEKYRKDGVEILSFVDLTLAQSEKAYLEKNPVFFPIIENAHKFGDEFLPFYINKPYIVFVDKYGRMRFFLTQDDITFIKSNINEKVMGKEMKPVAYKLEDKILQLLKE
jgi:hypothetical protein